MLQKSHDKQQQVELVVLEQMILQDHLLQRLARSIDFSFIHKLCEPLHCSDNGRPAIDPEVPFRMLFAGYLYGIRSEILYTDSTHVKAKANKHKKATAEIGHTPKAYFDELDQAIATDREAQGHSGGNRSKRGWIP